MKTLIATVRRQKLFQEGETVVVAVSGGADSVALLDILTRLEAERLNLVVAHLNHGLRGAASDGDEEFVSRLAAGYGIPFEARRVDVAELARKSRLSLEDAGRKARYAFFDETARARGATSVALAHHLDDQAETVLIRLLRGAGGTGLSAMAGSSGMLKRPLLQVSRAELERYLRQRGLSYRNDESNADTAILRNSIRHELVPLLKRYNPKISQRLAATAEMLASDEELLEQLTGSAFERLALRQESEVALSIEGLLSEPRGLRMRLYRRALVLLRGDLQAIGLRHLESIDGLLSSERPHAWVKLPADSVVERCYGELRFRKSEATAPADWEFTIAGEGCYQLPRGGSLLVERVASPAQLDAGTRRVAYLHPEEAPFPWVVRNFAPGDRFTPLGMAGEQKVKDLFINRKLPLAIRRRVPLVVSAGRIVWVGGVMMADGARVTASADAVLRLEILEITP